MTQKWDPQGCRRRLFRLWEEGALEPLQYIFTWLNFPTSPTDQTGLFLELSCSHCKEILPECALWVVLRFLNSISQAVIVLQYIYTEGHIHVAGYDVPYFGFSYAGQLPAIFQTSCYYFVFLLAMQTFHENGTEWPALSIMYIIMNPFKVSTVRPGKDANMWFGLGC